jgi:hypothetical protein
MIKNLGNFFTKIPELKLQKSGNKILKKLGTKLQKSEIKKLQKSGNKNDKKIWKQKLQKYGNFCSQIFITKILEQSYKNPGTKLQKSRNKVIKIWEQNLRTKIWEQKSGNQKYKILRTKIPKI